jgi:YidC/Oxa1 family membrane protein insertase
MGNILYPLKYAVAWIMVHVHGALSAIGMPEDSGWTWALSIVGLVIIIRIILIPLFVKQIKASRGMQLIQPQMQAIQKKYKGKTDPESRQAMTQETMALYKESGTNPFASCLPIILQAPIFFALFRVLNQNVRQSEAIGPLTKHLAQQADQSTIFGVSLSSTFVSSHAVDVKIITVVLIILMSVTTFTTQRQLMRKNMPAAALDNPFAKQQKMLMYVLPLVFAFSGVNFPIGVLLYWLTTNVWTMCQQFYVIRRMPAPGSLAEKALIERRQRRGKALPAAEGGEASGASGDGASTTGTTGGQRVQPKRQQRGKRPARPEAAAGAVEAAGDVAAEESPATAADSEPSATTASGGRSSAAPRGGAKPSTGKPKRPKQSKSSSKPSPTSPKAPRSGR